MKVRHDKNADAVMITLNNRQSTYGKRVLPDVIIRYDEENKIVAIEILDASEHVVNPDTLEYQDITSNLPELPLTAKD